MPSVAHLDQEEFAKVVEQSAALAIVDFTADWCPPCRILAPHLDALARELGPDVVIAKVDVDEHPELASRFGVLSLPTLLFFRGGQVVDRVVGALPPDRLRTRAAELVGR